ncbi:MAG: hypothetical protein VX527_03410, partial [Planctomycetota bacterium]|nr:hypothetical protein [Planctomycetota bacterium]
GPNIAQNVQGGAIYHLGTQMTLENCCFIENEAASSLVYDSPTSNVLVGGHADGGAIYRVGYQSLKIRECRFANNKAVEYCHPDLNICGEAYGGAIFDADLSDFDDSHLEIDDSLFCGNIPGHIDGESSDTDFEEDMFLEYCPCFGDVNADGSVDVNDVLDVINAWGSNQADTDLDNNGIVDVNDLLTVIENWNECNLDWECKVQP